MTIVNIKTQSFLDTINNINEIIKIKIQDTRNIDNVLIINEIPQNSNRISSIDIISKNTRTFKIHFLTIIHPPILINISGYFNLVCLYTVSK